MQEEKKSFQFRRKSKRTSDQSIGNIDKVLHKELFFPRTMGIFPFCSVFELTTLRLLHSIVIQLIVLALSLFTFLWPPLTWLQNGTYHLHIFEMVLVTSSNFISFVWLVYKAENLRIIVEKLHRVEYMLLTSGVDVGCHPRFCEKCWKLLLIFSATAGSIAYRIHSTGFFLTSMIYYISTPLLFTLLDPITSLLYVLRSCLQCLRFIEHNETLLKALESLSSTCEIIIDCYGPPLCFVMSSLFIFVICSLYFGMTTPNLPVHSKSLILLWSIIYIYPIICIIRATTVTSKEVDKVNKILFRRLFNGLSNEIIDFHMIAKRNVVFSPCGCFNLDTSLISSMIKTGTTYLVILMQYVVQKNTFDWSPVDHP